MWNIRNSINGEEKLFIFGIDSSNALRLNLDITMMRKYLGYDARPIDKIINLIKSPTEFK
jgi:hypothetical protein